MKNNILITGLPKSGKSTILREIVSNIDNKVGFVTNEIRENDSRVGFEIETNSGEKIILSHINFKTKFKVSKWFVDLDNLESVIPKVSNFNEEDLLYLDEIAEMQIFSEKFKKLVLDYLDSDNICLAIVSKVYEDDFIKRIKSRDDVILVEISEDNRQKKENFIKDLIRKIDKAMRYVQNPERFEIKGNVVKINSDHGTRTLTKDNDSLSCVCDFFKENKICSHVIAVEEFTEKD